MTETHDQKIARLMEMAAKWKHTKPMTGESVDCQDALKTALRTELAATSAKPANPQLLELVLEQAEDEALWCKAHTIIESVLQAALRELHAAIEAQPVPPAEGDAKDAERLDWLSESFSLQFIRQGCNHKVTSGARLRDHIDAAIASQKAT